MYCYKTTNKYVEEVAIILLMLIIDFILPG
jgi:hypothetical protein